jgi:DNA polymerase
MGAKKFQDTCAKYDAETSFDEAKRSVTAYRTMYKPIKKLWDNVHSCCIAATQYPGTRYKTNKCEFVCLPDKKGNMWLIITLPSGTKLYYHSPQLSDGKYGPELKHMGLVKYKWTRRYLSPGRITENIIQKLARDLMAYSIMKVSECRGMFQILMTVHDELVVLGNDDSPKSKHTYLLKLMEKTPKWAKTIPLRAGGFYGPRYKKD